jgi:hypothetical protein
MLVLSKENYYSPQANREYMSHSQYKDFLFCEAMALAKLNGEYEPPTSDEYLVGSYVHSWNENALEQFKAEHPEIISSKGPTKGQLKAGFQCADRMIATLASDPMCMFALEGQKEVIMTAELFGAMWKIRMDTYNPERHRIVDLKTAKSIREMVWSAEQWAKVSFVEAYGYLTQLAIYCEVERRATGEKGWAEPLIVAVSKEDPPDKAIISLLDEPRFEQELEIIRDKMPRIIAVKGGEIAPRRCEKCAWCRSTKKLAKVMHYSELKAG